MEVVTAKQTRKQRRKRERRIRDRHGFSVFTVDGRRHLYLNSGIPEGAPMESSVCATCQHGYAQLMHSQACRCDECRLERIAEWALRVQDETGMDLGWSRPSSVKDSHVASHMVMIRATPNDKSTDRIVWETDSRVLRR